MKTKMRWRPRYVVGIADGRGVKIFEGVCSVVLSCTVLSEVL